MKKYSNNLYNRHLKNFAHSLRSNGTKSEACLWKYVLRDRQMKGYTFRRQRPILKYIADFCCLPLKLVIELDGITHHDEAVQKKDELKEKALTENGFTVLRFADSEVLDKINSVRGVIEKWIEENEVSASTSPPPALRATPASGGQIS